MDMSTEYTEVNRISDVIDVIENDNAVLQTPYLKILEQPEEFIRYRYESEGSSAGIIKGINSTLENKTFPTVQVVGYKGPVVVILSCVTKDEPYRTHPHNLVWKRGHNKGVCNVEIHNEEMIHSFDHLGIKCVKRGDIKTSLKIRQEIRVDPFETGFAHMKKPKSIDLNAIRLCFHAFIIESTGLKMIFKPVVSNIIYDEKSLCNLNIYQLSHASASVTGGLTMILLCEKVNEDVCVRMFEEQNGQEVWEEIVKPVRVHKHVAITFTTPRYKTIQVEEPVKVYIQLKQSGPVKAGNFIPFKLIPPQPVARASVHPYPVRQSMLFSIPPEMECDPVGFDCQNIISPSNRLAGTLTSLGTSTDLVEQKVVCSTSHHITNTMPEDIFRPCSYSLCHNKLLPSTSRLDYNPDSLNYQEHIFTFTSQAAAMPTLETPSQLLAQDKVGSFFSPPIHAVPGTTVMQNVGNQMDPYNFPDETYDDTSILRKNDITKITTVSVENVSMNSLSQYLISGSEEKNLSENLSSLSLSL